MIKPNTLCMIRGVPKTKPGWECNGKIVIAVAVKKTIPEIGRVWRIDPPLPRDVGGEFSGCAERWLHPLDGCEDELAREALDAALHDIFVKTLVESL